MREVASLRKASSWTAAGPACPLDLDRSKLVRCAHSDVRVPLWSVNTLTSPQSDVGVAVTENDVLAEPSFPALSVASAVRAWAPGPNDHAAPVVEAHVDDATPES